MNCEKARDLLVDYLGGEIGRQEGRDFMQHLLACPACRQELASLRSTQSALVQGWPEEPIPQPLSFKLAQPSPPAARRFWGWGNLPAYLRWPAALTASFVLCVSVLALSRTSFQYTQTGFSLSFGGTSSGRVGSGDCLQEQAKIAMDRQIDQRLNEQDNRLKQVLADFEGRWNSKQQSGFQRVAGQLNYLESTQNLIWKEAAQNKSYMESLARDLYLRSGVARADRASDPAVK